MPEYKYTALTAKGYETKGTINALNKAEAISNLKREGLFPTKIQSASRPKDDSISSKDKNELIQKYLETQPTSFNPLTIFKNYIRRKILLKSLEKEED